MRDLIDATDYTVFEIAAVIAKQITEPYTMADNLRSAVMFSPLVMTRAEWIAAASVVGIHSGTAGNRYREVRLFQKELGEIA